MQLTPRLSLADLTSDPRFPSLSAENTEAALSSRLILANLEQLAQAIEEIKTLFDRDVHILSAFRCAKLNAAHGSGPSSQHRLGEAVDFCLWGLEDTRGMSETLEAIRFSGIRFHRLAIERGSLHFGTYRTGQPNGEVVICDDDKFIVLQEATIEALPGRAATRRRASNGGPTRDRKQ